MDIFLKSAFLVMAMAPSLLSGVLVKPCPAAPAIVVRGDTLRVAYARSDNSPVDSIVLIGPYSRQTLVITGSTPGTVVWDEITGASYDIAVNALVPQGTILDMYDLAIFSGTYQDTARVVVRVVASINNPFSFIHYTDAHVSREWGNGYALELEYVSRISAMARIMGVEFMVCTGDLIMDYSNDNGFGVPGSADEVWSNFFNGAGGFGGARSCGLPVYLTTGNHDYRDAGDMPGEWNSYCGLRSYGFAYGQARFLVFDSELGNDYPAGQTTGLEDWLSQAGNGSIRVLMQHNRTDLNSEFCDNNRIRLALFGHIHENHQYQSGTTPTILLETASAGHFGYVGAANVGWFRYVTIQDSTVVSYPALQYGNTIAQTDSLTLSFQNQNDGLASENTATITNNFHMALPACRIRFVMAQGNYLVQGGTVEQTFNSGSMTICDVRADAPMTGSVAVDIAPATVIERQAVIPSPAVNAHPNPFNPSVTFSVTLSQSQTNGSSLLQVYDIQGKCVYSLTAHNSRLKAGISWDASTLPGGVYCVVLRAGSATTSKRIVLVR